MKQYVLTDKDFDNLVLAIEQDVLSQTTVQIPDKYSPILMKELIYSALRRNFQYHIRKWIDEAKQ